MPNASVLTPDGPSRFPCTTAYRFDGEKARIDIATVGAGSLFAGCFAQKAGLNVR